VMKPKPFSELNHFTVPVATCDPLLPSAGSGIVHAAGPSAPAVTAG